MPHHTAGHTRSREMQQCIENCQNCYTICTETVNYCLQKGDKYAEIGSIRLLLDCAEICQTSADFMLRGSDLHPQSCALCADVCDRCAQMCSNFGSDTQMKACADLCRRCAQSCRQMAGTQARSMAA